MREKIFIWAWNTHSGIYVNQESSLIEIIKYLIEDMLYEHELRLEVVQHSETITITYIHPKTKSKVSISCDAEPNAVEDMLEGFAEEHEKVDTFAIKEFFFS
ncbi:TPA: hypothetical protein QDB06_000859 [Burkholderia vietnamiensis]|nr:hypothetical protein [Burkholderia vietnamiensis]